MNRIFDFASAIVRTPGASVVNGLSDHGGDPPSAGGVEAEHRAYVAALEAAGLAVDTLPALEAYPDSMFVEDPAFVLPEGAILLRSKAPTRAGEARHLAPILRGRFDRVLELDRGCADGGDILVLPDEILIGLSGRTDREGAERFVALAAELGRGARIVETAAGVLHLKSACALVDEETVIATPALARSHLFEGREVVVTPDGEEGAANLVRVGDTVLAGSEYPGVSEMLARRGLDVVALSTREIAKLDAGLSCMSLRW